MNESTTRNLLRLSLALSLPAFAVLAAIHVARADLATNPQTQADFATIAAKNKISAQSVQNLLQNLDSRIDAVARGPVFVGPSAAVVTGNISGGGNGYLAAAKDCNLSYPGSHMCTTLEMVRTLQGSTSPQPGGKGLWVAAGADYDYLDTDGTKHRSDDCAGFQNDNVVYGGTVWGTDSAMSVTIAPCNESHAIACCGIQPLTIFVISQTSPPDHCVDQAGWIYHEFWLGNDHGRG